MCYWAVQQLHHQGVKQPTSQRGPHKGGIHETIFNFSREKILQTLAESKWLTKLGCWIMVQNHPYLHPSPWVHGSSSGFVNTWYSLKHLTSMTRNLLWSNWREKHFAEIECKVIKCCVSQVQFAQTRCAKYSLLFNKWRQFDVHALDEFRIKVMRFTKIEDTFSFFRALLPTLIILQKTSAALQGLPWTLRTSARSFDFYI